MWVLAFFKNGTLVIQEMKRLFPICLVDFGEMNHELIQEMGGIVEIQYGKDRDALIHSFFEDVPF